MATNDEEKVFFIPEEKIREKVALRFAEVNRKLQSLVPHADIQHVGSTAIPSSLTKGDLDIQIRVTAEEFLSARERLLEVYSVNEGGFAGDDAMSFEDYSSDPSLGVHLTVIGGSADIQHTFRDKLIASPALREEYDNLKRQFEGGSMHKYRDAKTVFVEKVLMDKSK